MVEMVMLREWVGVGRWSVRVAVRGLVRVWRMSFGTGRVVLEEDDEIEVRESRDEVVGWSAHPVPADCSGRVMVCRKVVRDFKWLRCWR